MRIEAITFDVTHTLLHCPRLGEIYSEVLGRHGIPVSPPDALRLVKTVWQELSCAADPGRDRFSSHPDGERGWWARFLERLCELLDAPPPSRFAAAELFHRFGRAESWEVYPEVPRVLAELRGQGLRLAVISNWDHRLPGLLAELGLAPSFEAVVYSSAVGVEKPDRRIFGRALELLQLAPAAVLHVGDGRLEDFEGAAAVGFAALHLVRQERGKVPASPGRGEILDLTALPGIVAARASGTRVLNSRQL
ncbi:MAG TPA: HAD-IA family hydrolase [Thermoanaerobaculia bacterium]|nr:HAD-IA family hydrolase [Thermoanaerobaculia bacterium]